jgi:hypothetical protein
MSEPAKAMARTSIAVVFAGSGGAGAMIAGAVFLRAAAATALVLGDDGYSFGVLFAGATWFYRHTQQAVMIGIQPRTGVR